LKEELKAAEIPLGTETYQIMVDAGFSEADGAAHTRGERTDKTVSTPADIQNFSLNDVFQQLYSGQITGEEFTAQFDQLREQLTSPVGSLINTTT